MRVHVFAALLLFGQLASPSVVAGQTSDGLNIVVTRYRVSSNGGERRGGLSVVDATTFGRTSSSTNILYRATGCTGGVGIAADMGNPSTAQSEVAPGKLAPMPVDSAWTVDVTPMRVVGDAATFKLKWSRIRDRQQPSNGPGGEVQLTLRPGQSLPLDMLSSPPPAGSSEPCVWSLRVGVERKPEPEADRRLLAVDLWLVARQPDGSERSQPVPLRGIPNNGMPFYFDRITSGVVSFDLFGELSVSGGTGAKSVIITLKNRVDRPVPAGLSVRREDFYYIDTKRITATVALDEVVSVPLPKMDQDFGVTDPTRTLSLRLRVRQLR